MEDFLSGALSFFLILGAAWLIVLVVVLITLYKRRDMELPVKIFWGLVIFFAPLIGLILYLIFGAGKRKR
jgi:hypothetical protein